MSSYGSNAGTETSASPVNAIINNTVILEFIHQSDAAPIIPILRFCLVGWLSQILHPTGLRSELFGSHKSVSS